MTLFTSTMPIEHTEYASEAPIGAALFMTTQGKSRGHHVAKSPQSSRVGVTRARAAMSSSSAVAPAEGTAIISILAAVSPRAGVHAAGGGVRAAVGAAGMDAGQLFVVKEGSPVAPDDGARAPVVLHAPALAATASPDAAAAEFSDSSAELAATRVHPWRDAPPGSAGLVRVSPWSLRFAGPPHLAAAAEEQYHALSGSETRGTRLLFLAITAIVAAAGLVGRPSDQPVSALGVSLATAVVAAAALLLLPAWAEATMWAAVTMLLVGLDLRETALLPGIAGVPDPMTLLAVMPIVMCVCLSPRLTHILPVLLAHAGYAGYLFIQATPKSVHRGGKTFVVLVSVVLIAGVLYMCEAGRRERVLANWRLEQAVAEHADELAKEKKFARTTDREMHRFESAG
jgi:hypothetical protein